MLVSRHSAWAFVAGGLQRHPGRERAGERERERERETENGRVRRVEKEKEK